MSTDLESTARQLERSRPDPMVILERLIDKGVDIDKLKPMMDLVQDYNRQRAAEDFAAAVTRFQGLMPAVEKTNAVYGKNKDLGPQYHFANLCDILDIAQPILTDCGIAVTFDSENVQGGLKAICHVRVGTHVQSTAFTVAMPTIPNANGSQISGAALEYAKRYAMRAALNIRTKGEDNDAQGLHDHLKDEQVAELNGLFDDCRKAGNEVNTEAFWHYIGCTSMNDLPASKFELAKFELNRKKRSKVSK